MKSVARDHCKSSDVYCFLFLRMNSPNFFLAQPTHSHVLSHGVFHAWTASCEFWIFCPCGHVWDVKWIWTKFLAAEIASPQMFIVSYFFSWTSNKMKKHHHGQASLGILHHIFICHGVLKSWVVSLDWKLFCFKPERDKQLGFSVWKCISHSIIQVSADWKLGQLMCHCLGNWQKTWIHPGFSKKNHKRLRPSHMCFGDLTPPQLVFPAKFDGV